MKNAHSAQQNLEYKIFGPGSALKSYQRKLPVCVQIFYEEVACSPSPIKIGVLVIVKSS